MTRHLPYDRAERVAEQIQHAVATACLTELTDPRLSGVEITRVKMTRDLRIARVYFHMAGADSARQDEARKGLIGAAGFLKRTIGREVKLRFMPELEIFYDEELDQQRRIDKLLDDLHKG